MTQHSKGFMLLEVVIGTMIASVISMILMSALGQMTKISQQVDEMYERTFQLIMIHHQFERDIMGMYVPLQGITNEEPSNSEKKNVQDKNNSATKNKLVKQKQIKKIFSADISNTQQMQQLTFITNNPLPRYWQGQVGTANPKIVRVIYYLQPSKENAQSFVLMRQELADLYITNVENGSSAKAYPIADHIQSFSLTFSYQTIKEGNTKNVNVKTESAQVNSWNSDELLEKKNQNNPKKYFSLLPYSITISGYLWNQTYTNTTPFSLTIPILANGFNAPIIYEQPKQDPKKQLPEKEPQEPSDQKEQSVALEIKDMKEIIEALGGTTGENIVIVSDSNSTKKQPFIQAPIVHIPFDSITIGTP